MRGDDPPSISEMTVFRSSSPHARGCSDDSGTDAGAGAEFPACAGMFRIETATGGSSGRVPRMRGDDPFHGFAIRRYARSSPHARG